MPSVAVVRELMNLGLAGDDLLAALERIESAEIRGSSADRKSVDEQAERRRERDRLRKSAERLRKSADRTCVDDNIINTNQVCINNNSPLPPQSADNPQNEPDIFETKFWVVYPRKVGKGAARRAWKTAILKTSPVTIASAAERFAAKCVGKDENYIPHAATWLNGERWQDADLQEPSKPKAVSSKVYVQYGTAAGDAWERHHRQNGKPIPRDGRGGWWFDTEYPQENAA